MSYHLVFTGSPGTGKTTVARIVARIYKDLGVLKSGHTVETDRSGLVAEYMGQTAMKTNAIIDSALNGVLFIDEAYALVPEEGSGRDYGQEAISTLLKRMEDDRDKLVVIIAGYTNEMKRFIDSNPGLQSRFNRYIDFRDYTGAELFEIYCMYANKNQYKLTPEAAEYLKKFFNYAVAHKDRNFGNARYARNIFEKSIQLQANRLSTVSNATKEQLTLLTIDDVKTGGK
jgi:SpoVK/Ycf46/Vps4 family AAA+-type ATPase